MTKPTDKAIELLQPVLEWLDDGAKHKKVGFGMSEFLTFDSIAVDHKGNSCGTVCCIAGAVVKFNKQEFGKTRKFYANHDISKVGKVMGMSEEDQAHLFYANKNDRYTGSMLPNELSFDEIKPKHAAKVIRKWIETGEVNWN